MKKVAAFSILILVMIFTGCGNDPKTVDEGTVRLIINVNHHGFPIADARIYRINGTTVWPGEDTTLYETVYQCDANGNLTISDIGNGTKDLVLYAKGIDPGWDSTTITPVHGYQMFHIVTSIGEDKDIPVSLYVSE
jgi:hypothetical protein